VAWVAPIVSAPIVSAPIVSAPIVSAPFLNSRTRRRTSFDRFRRRQILEVFSVSGRQGRQQPEIRGCDVFTTPVHQRVWAGPTFTTTGRPIEGSR
jgi:hypothetical protein